MKTICTFLIAALLLTVSGAQAEPVTGLLNGKLVTAQGKNFTNYDTAQLDGKKYFAVYFSANWCPPCRAFTPKLVEFYKKAKTRHPNFELIFVSRDEDEKKMLGYMKDDKMLWPAVKFSAAKSSALNKYLGPGIPCLVFINADGEVLSNSYVDGKYVGPYQVLEDIEKTLKKEKSSATVSEP